jgi:hypothetical protein
MHKKMAKHSIFIFCVSAFIAGCAEVPKPQHVIKLEGKSNTECEIINGSRSLGKFTVPSTFTFDGKIEDITAICTIGDSVANIEVTPKAPSQEEKLVIRDYGNNTPTQTRSVQIIVK